MFLPGPLLAQDSHSTTTQAKIESVPAKVGRNDPCPCGSGKKYKCHLAIEKALKGVYYEKRREFPPKSHNLIYLLNEIGIMPPEEHGRFMVKLSEAGVNTRYPEDLANVQKVYHDAIVKDILVRGKEVITWIRGQL